MESCYDDIVIRQRLDTERMENTLKRGEFYVLENEGRAEPGFLVFLHGKSPVYVQYKKGRPPTASTLRMRVSSTVAEGGGSVLVATLDDVLHTLRLEDVWMWRGAPIYKTEGYTARRERLKEFAQRHWVPDARLLGGIFTKVAHPMSLEEFSLKGVSGACSSLEFVPEQGGRRRMVFFLEEMVKAATGPAGLKQDRKNETVQRVETHTVASAAPSPQLQRRAKAVPVDKMPDVYDLFDDAGFPISRASVQQFSLSQALRAAIQKEPSGVWVLCTWRQEFGGYEITRQA